ncbi:6-aminohexanoate-cyclic-dimer hydrolase [Companilactobacillus tucceti DSM 20183]|uniref:6-aminohexanoate-cyclic-dimer hydrolase n=2 Tax=Companilactobacillus tucceti TaxID=238012 RepID=A0A0R1IY18_9LACO|nr:6-aminohexanoate-cyclic-dimer hydrolase [Companilactobacillus tucceti DSM 20183]
MTNFYLLIESLFIFNYVDKQYPIEGDKRMNYHRLQNKISKIILLLVLFTVGAPTQTIFADQIDAPTENVSEFTLSDYENSSALQLAEAVRSKRVTSVQLVEYAYQEIEKKDGSLNAMISLRKDEALKEASEIQDTGQPFFGVPILLKGLGHTISGGSNTNGLYFEKDVISHGTSRITKSFQDEGFIVIGQTNFPEMGLKNITDSKLYGPTGSSWNPNYQAGGSSGGSATGVGAGYAPVATGSDSGGSIRIPASWNGIIGFKPSRASMTFDSKSERNQTSHFAETKTMADTDKLYDDFSNGVANDIKLDPKTMKIAYTTDSPVNTPVSSDAKKAVERAVEFLKSQGYQVEKVKYPIDGTELMNDYDTIGAGSSGIIDYLATSKLKRHLEIGDVDLSTWAIYQLGKSINKDDVTNAWNSVNKIAEKMNQFHQKYPIFLTPTTASTAPKVGDPLMTSSLEQRIRNMDSLSKEDKAKLALDQWMPSLNYSPFTQISNLTGEPAISLPTYVSASGLPLGIQFNAARNNDRLLLQLGDLFESNGRFNQKDLTESSNNNHVINKPKPDTKPSTKPKPELPYRPVSMPGLIVDDGRASVDQHDDVENQESNVIEPNYEPDNLYKKDVSKPNAKTDITRTKSLIKVNGNKTEKLPQTGEDKTTLGLIGVFLISGIIYIKINRN